MKNIFDDLDILQNIFIILISESDNKSIINNKILDKNKIINSFLLENEKMNNILNFRTINQGCNIIFKYYIYNLEVNFSPKVLYIDFSRCSICNMPICNSNRRILTYNYDKLPHKSIIYCTSSICRLKTLKRYILDSNKNNILLFSTINQNFKNEIIQEINRINKSLEFESFIDETIKFYKNNYYIKCNFYIKDSMKTLEIQKYTKIYNNEIVVNNFMNYTGK